MIHGASRCIICLEEEESSQHLFLECSLTKQVWNLFLVPIGKNLFLPGTLSTMVTNWKGCYPGKLGRKKNLGRIWNTTVKNVCWQIWLARNRLVFYNKKVYPQHIAFKANNMINKKLNSKQVVLPISDKLNVEELIWCQAFLL